MMISGVIVIRFRKAAARSFGIVLNLSPKPFRPLAKCFFAK